MHELSPEIRLLGTAVPEALASAALRRERRVRFSVRRELLVVMYVAVALLVGGVGLLVKANLDRIGPVALLCGLLIAALGCYAVAWRARSAGRPRSLGEDYLLLLGALLTSAALGFAEVQFQLLGGGWSRHLLLLAAWHLACAYLFTSRLVLSVALTAFAGWLGVEASLGTVFEARHAAWGAGPRSLLCALLFWIGSLAHRHEREAGTGFAEVYQHFAVNFGFWGALALGAQPATRGLGALVLLALAAWVGRAGWTQRRESFLLYAVGYSTVGLVWLQAMLLPSGLASWAGLASVAAAAALLVSLRSRLRDSGR